LLFGLKIKKELEKYIFKLCIERIDNWV